MGLRTAVIAGTLAVGEDLAEEADKVSVGTPYGEAEVYVSEGLVFIQRHGDADTPPHRINHHANIWALKEFAEEVVGVTSVGSLKEDITPGTLLVADDYVCFNPPTFCDDEIRHITPCFDEGLRQKILSCSEDILGAGVYVQVTGPRLETCAEVRVLAGWGDVVGMTAASEATLAQEAGLRYACICSVDNFAHGISGHGPDYVKIREAANANRDRVKKIMEEVLK